MGKLYKLARRFVGDLSSTPPSTEFRDRDTQKKFEGKVREDNRRGAKRSEIEIGDKVLMKNLLPKDKLSTDFHKEKFLVVDKEGTNVTIESDENDKRYERNTSHLRKITEPLNMTPLREYSGDHQMEALTSPPHVQHPFQHASPLIATEQIEPEIVISGDYQDAAPVRRSRVLKPKCRYSP